MITLLPFPDFVKSARCLDDAHLLLQIKDVIEILDLLHGNDQKTPKLFHTSVQMWRGYEFQLAEYGLTLCTELKQRDIPAAFVKDLDQHLRRIEWHQECATAGEDHTFDLPPWFGDSKIHLSHRSYLMRYDENHYGLYLDTDTPKNLPVVWPEIRNRPMQAKEVE